MEVELCAHRHVHIQNLEATPVRLRPTLIVLPGKEVDNHTTRRQVSSPLTSIPGASASIKAVLALHELPHLRRDLRES